MPLTDYYLNKFDKPSEENGFAPNLEGENSIMLKMQQ